VSGLRVSFRSRGAHNKGMKLTNRGSGGWADWLASSMLRFAAYAQCWADVADVAGPAQA